MKCAICGALKSNRESDPHGMFGYHEFTAAEEVIPEVDAEVDADIRGQSDDRT